MKKSNDIVEVSDCILASDNINSVMFLENLIPKRDTKYITIINKRISTNRFAPIVLINMK